MQIAVLSGKGGTGKTLLSVNLSYLADNATYVDCDVEEPNGLLYYKLKEKQTEDVKIKIPVINHEECIGCEKCTNFCKFNALAYILDKVRVFKDLCHSCGGCKLVCPTGAISEVDKVVGYVHSGSMFDTKIYSGEMIVGVESGVPIIDNLLKKVEDSDRLVFVDSPPGNGCSVMESIKDADYCLLIAEPTIFGLHNLNMVYKLAKVFDKKIGLVINKYTDNNMINNYAKENNIKIVGTIPMDLELGKLNSEGEIVASNSKYKPIFNDILKTIKKELVL
ncbi:4Fe-4S binding protein [Candidatus Izemoplasma sp. B36]|uniref:nucleotide-binding protein n=1 Tax=Candidatus Izemoplasma sp. B36 TaxID=3242468 RepID=UPI003558F2B3